MVHDVAHWLAVSDGEGSKRPGSLVQAGDWALLGGSGRPFYAVKYANSIAESNWS